MMERIRARISIPWLAAAAAVGLTLGPLLVGYEPVGGDPDRFHRPIKAELARSLCEGRLPFWSDRFGLGVPLVAESHVAAFYPPNLVLYRLADVSTAYRLSMWLHYLALAIATYAYARSQGIGRWGGSIAAISFTFCGFQAVHSSHEWAYHVLPYLPLALLVADRYVATGRATWLASVALIWGVQLTLGHFQVQAWTGCLVLLTGLWRIAADRRPWARGLGLVVALAWGAAMAAVQLAPMWELATIVGHTRRSFAELAFYSFPPANWAELAIPRLFRGLRGGSEAPYWYAQQTTGFEACLYVGTIPLILACVGLVGDGRARNLTFWRVAVPASFALATMPRWWPEGYSAFLQVPVLGYFRCPARHTVVTCFGLALLAGHGFDRSIPAGRFRLGLALAVVFGASAFAWGAWWTSRPDPAIRESFGGEPLLMRLGPAALTWLLGLAALIAWRRGRLGAWGPWLFSAVELGVLYYSMTTQWGWSVPLPAGSPILTRLAETPGVGRVGGAVGNLPVRAGLITASPYFGIPQPPPYRLLLAVGDPSAAADPVAARWLRRFGVSHVVRDGSTRDLEGEVVFAGYDDALDQLAYRPPQMKGRRTWRVVRLPDPFPSARVAIRASVAPDLASLVDRLSRSDAADEAWFLPADLPPEDPSPRARSARVLSWDGLSGRVEHDGTCDLVIARTAYPGWTARVDGGPERPITPADGGLQSVRLVGSGISRVSLHYRPTNGRAAVGVSLGAVATALLVLSASGARRPRFLFMFRPSEA